jgi:DNA polymerase-3 subunit epsilon
MNLDLSKPLSFIDLETTGLDISNDRIVEISIMKIEVNGNKNSITRRINPECPIPPITTSIHGIKDEDVANEPNFKSIGSELKNFIGNSDLAGFNSNKFDVPLLVEEFLRADIDFDMSKRKLIDVQNIFHKMEKRTLVAAYKFYCNKELINAHSAEADVIATSEVLYAQLEKYPNLERNTSFLQEFSAMKKKVDLAGRIVFDEKDQKVFNFGKYKGRLVEDVFKKDPSYYNWMMNANFSLETKRVLTQIKLSQKSNSQ